MSLPVITGWGIERRAVGFAERLCRHQGVEGGEDEAGGAVLAIGPFLVVPQNRETLQDVLDVAAFEAVEEAEGGVELSPELGAALRYPAERWAVVAEVTGKGSQIPGGVEQVEHPCLHT